MKTINQLKLKECWKQYEDGTAILVVRDVQVAAVQPADGDGNYEVYNYDADFGRLFISLDNYIIANKEELMNKVENLFIGWVRDIQQDLA